SIELISSQKGIFMLRCDSIASFLLCLGVAASPSLTGVAASAGDDLPSKITVPTQLTTADLDSRPRVSPPSVVLELSEARPAALKSAPEVKATIQWAEFKPGEQTFTIGLARGEEGQLELFVDADGDGKLNGEDERLTLTGQKRERKGKVISTRWETPVTLGGQELRLFAMESRGGLMVRLSAVFFRKGVVPLKDAEGETSMLLVVVDQDLNGRYGSAGDYWWFGDQERAEGIRLSHFNMIEADEPVFHNSRSWRLEKLADNGSATVLADGESGKFSEYLARRTERVNTKWFERFDKEKKSFLERNKNRFLAPPL
ncbi:MAG: hypothetical protein V3T77_04815, partial [Planctomycetota bacterium]